MGKEKFNLKTPKGTKDWAGVDIAIRDTIFNSITSTFKKHGAVSLDTPVFELRDILSGKYGEDSKLIYNLEDQGGEICSLRYDLTVPFARWLAMNPTVQSIKRYHLAKVYRRDQPAVTKGRMREFYQCDFDIAGTYDPMLPDAEVLRITKEIMDDLDIGTYTIKLNHRKILDGLFAVCGVPEDKIRTISSAVDKLDKAPWQEVKKEMVEQKGLEEAVADKIGEWVVKKGGKELIAELQSSEVLTGNEKLKQGLDEMELLFTYLDALDVTPTVSFDLSLARGLDYYTGIIYEVVTELSAPPSQSQSTGTAGPSKKPKRKPKSDDPEADRSDDDSVGVGSIAAGGRYDNLVGMFASNAKGNIPCVGISFGVDRIFSIIRQRLEKSEVAVRSSEVDVYVMALGSGLLQERLEVLKLLWDAGVKAEFLYKVKPRMPAQFKAAEQGGVPFSVIIGDDEWNEGKVKVKELGLEAGHPEKEGIVVAKEDMVAEIKKRLGKSELEKKMAKMSVGDAAGEPVVVEAGVGEKS